MTSTQIMKPSDEAKTDGRRASSPRRPRHPEREDGDAADDARVPEPLRDLPRLHRRQRRADDHRRGAGGRRSGDARVGGERGGLEREQRGSAQHDEAREEAVRVVADEPRAGCEEPEVRKARPPVKSELAGLRVLVPSDQRRMPAGRRRSRVAGETHARVSAREATTSADEAEAGAVPGARASGSARSGSTRRARRLGSELPRARRTRRRRGGHALAAPPDGLVRR